MKKKYDKGVSGSVQAKEGRLYFVAGYNDPITQKRKTKWITLGLPEGTKKSIVNKAQREVQAKFEEEYKRALEGYDDPSAYPLLTFLTDWLEKVHRYKIQESTFSGYRGKVNGKIKRFFGEKVTLADCKPRLIHQFYDSLRSEGDSERTILHYHNLLHAAFEYAVKQEIFEYNPMGRVDRPQPKKFVGSFYSVEEVKTLLALAEGDPIYIPIVLAAYYGVRRSEALGLAWESVDFENKIIYIRQKAVEVERDGKVTVAISDEMKNESSRRTLPLVPEVEEILLKQKEKQAERCKRFRKAYSKEWQGMVCVDSMGALFRPNYITAHFPLLLEQNGLRKIRFHDLRHTCASLLLSQNVNMKVIQMWLGHSSMKTTADIYAHLDSASKNEAGKILMNLLGVDGEEE